jgi:hypothetical protein
MMIIIIIEVDFSFVGISSDKANTYTKQYKSTVQAIQNTINASTQHEGVKSKHKEFFD